MDSLPKGSKNKQNVKKKGLLYENFEALLVKKPVAIGATVLWGLLFVTDLMGFTATLVSEYYFVFLNSLLTLVSSGFRGLVLKEGRDLDSIKVVLYFMMFITGVMFAAFGSSMNLFGS